MLIQPGFCVAAFGRGFRFNIAENADRHGGLALVKLIDKTGGRFVFPWRIHGQEAGLTTHPVHVEMLTDFEIGTGRILEVGLIVIGDTDDIAGAG